MRILVCVKIVQGEVNPFDASALECALTLSDDVTVLSMGPESSEDVLSSLTRLGAKVILISDRLYAGSDTLATANVLTAAIKRLQFDLILCGRQSIDGSTAQVGVMLSQMLGCGLVTGAISVSLENNSISVKTRNGEEDALLPALITVEKGYRLRFPSIFSKRSDIELWDNTVLSCEPCNCGLQGSATRVTATFKSERGKRKCSYISPDKLLPLIEQLRHSEKERTVYNNSDCKMLSGIVWAVGDAAASKADCITKSVVKLPELTADEIIKMAEENKPDVILWSADEWGRRNASIAAAALKTGLCADCTRLETDGKKLFVYRPAFGGQLTAKIEFTRKPQMATVRTKTESEDIIVAGGRGAACGLDKLKTLANKLGAQVAASRGLVDMDKMPYSAQVGLTGKTVSPKIYIAAGISGAVQHVCAVEGADYIIAINSDPDAPIFEYADYGIVGDFCEL